MSFFLPFQPLVLCNLLSVVLRVPLFSVYTKLEFLLSLCCLFLHVLSISAVDVFQHQYDKHKFPSCSANRMTIVLTHSVAALTLVQTLQMKTVHLFSLFGL